VAQSSWEIFFQVPRTTDAHKFLRAWQKQPDRNISTWRGYTVCIVDDTGEDLGAYDLGDPGLHDLSKGGGGGGEDSGPSDAERQGLLNKERAMEPRASERRRPVGAPYGAPTRAPSAPGVNIGDGPSRQLTAGGVEKPMQYPVDIVCYRCAIVLPVLDTPVGRAAWWRFMDEHAYHPVEILWEHSEAWGRIDIDFIQGDSDISGDPSLAEYAGDDWAGRPLALEPRPVARVVAEIVTRVEDTFAAGEWQAGAGDAVVAEWILEVMDFAPPPGAEVDAVAVRARVAAVDAAGERLHQAQAKPVGEHFGALLKELLLTLPSAVELPVEELIAESGPPASPRLWDAERALRLVQHLLNHISIR
jgi:hypothetical protein